MTMLIHRFRCGCAEQTEGSARGILVVDDEGVGFEPSLQLGPQDIYASGRLSLDLEREGGRLSQNEREGEESRVMCNTGRITTRRPCPVFCLCAVGIICLR
jgi:hypothetical protein